MTSVANNLTFPQIYGCRIEQVILHEIYHRDPDGVCPLYSELMASRDAVPEVRIAASLLTCTGFDNMWSDIGATV